MSRRANSSRRPTDEVTGAWPNEGIQLPVALGEAVQSGKRLRITYRDRYGKDTERWVTPIQVTGLSDYIYLQAYCHLRNGERSFCLDRIVDVEIEASHGHYIA